MKIRTGFVSNSSSSSFLIYGADLSQYRDEILELLKIEEDEYNDEILEILCKDTGLTYTTGSDYDSMYVGRSWDDVRDDETGLEFKRSVETKIKNILGKDVKCYTIKEAWYNG